MLMRLKVFTRLPVLASLNKVSRYISVSSAELSDSSFSVLALNFTNPAVCNAKILLPSFKVAELGLHRTQVA